MAGVHALNAHAQEAAAQLEQGEHPYSCVEGRPLEGRREVERCKARIKPLAPACAAALPLLASPPPASDALVRRRMQSQLLPK